MGADAPLILGTDFVAVPMDDFEDSCHFYGEVLGLPCIARYGRRRAPSSKPATSCWR